MILERPPTPADSRHRYGSAPSQFGDLFLPKRAGPHPLVVAFHGGFWRARYDLAHLSPLCRALADAGLAVFSAEYRRLGEDGGGFPGTCEDALAAAQFAASLLGVSAPPLLLGHSAGGHLALWVAKAFPVRAVVALAAVSDLALAAELGLSDGVATQFAAPLDPGDAQVSPLARLPLGVAQRLIHGEADDVVPIALSERYLARACALSDPASLVRLPGAGHYALIDPESAAFACVLDAIRSNRSA